MKTVAAADAQARLSSILDDVQREPIIVRKDEKDVAVVLSISDYKRLREGNTRAFLELRNEVAAQAAAKGLTEQRIAELLTRDEA